MSISDADPVTLCFDTQNHFPVLRWVPTVILPRKGFLVITELDPRNRIHMFMRTLLAWKRQFVRGSFEEIISWLLHIGDQTWNSKLTLGLFHDAGLYAWYIDNRWEEELFSQICVAKIDESVLIERLKICADTREIWEQLTCNQRYNFFEDQGIICSTIQ